MLLDLRLRCCVKRIERPVGILKTGWQMAKVLAVEVVKGVGLFMCLAGVHYESEVPVKAVAGVVVNAIECWFECAKC